MLKRTSLILASTLAYACAEDTNETRTSVSSHSEIDQEQNYTDATDFNIRNGKVDSTNVHSVTALLAYQSAGGDWLVMCSGSLMSTKRNKFLTAAHCVFPQGILDITSSKYRVYFSNGQKLTSFFSVSSVAVNPRYSMKDPIEKAGQHDYAVLTLQQSVPKDQDIGAVIPFYYGDSTLAGGTQVTVVGFGTTESLDAGIIRRFGTSVVTASDSPGSLVMKPGPSGQGICSGDSGGPAIAMINGAPRVVGVASWIASNPFIEKNDISSGIQMCKNLAETNHASLAADGTNENKLWLAAQLGDSIGNEPASPKNLVAKNGSKNNGVSLSWLDSSNNETGFKIERKISNGKYEVIHTAKPNITSYEDVISGNRLDATYRVRSTNGIILSKYSNQASLSGSTPTGTVPSDPKNLVAIMDSGSSVTLKWEDTSKDETGFRIYVPMMGPAVQGQSSRNLIGTARMNATSLTLNYVDQTYLVVAFNNIGESEPAAVSLIMLQIPKSPSKVTAKKLSSTSVQLNWSDMSTDEAGFKVYKVIPASGSGKPTYSMLTKVDRNIATFTYKSAKAGDQYIVVAFNDAGESQKPKTAIPFPR
jgi:hypothetical protein